MSRIALLIPYQEEKSPNFGMHTFPTECIHHLSLKGVTIGACHLTTLSQLSQERASHLLAKNIPGHVCDQKVITHVAL